MQTAVIVDIDGTLADTRAYAGKWEEGVKSGAFEIRADIVAMVKEWARDNAVAIVTARNAKHTDVTRNWLAHNGIPCDMLFLNPGYGNAAEYKAGIVEEITRMGIEIVASFDDEAANNEMFEDFGFIQVIEV